MVKKSIAFYVLTKNHVKFWQNAQMDNCIIMREAQYDQQEYLSTQGRALGIKSLYKL